MAPYISLNTELRKQATSEFEKNFFKPMNNSVFGKTMQNLRNRIDVRLVRPHETEKIKKLVSSPLFNRYTVFSGSSLAGRQMHKSKIELNRPVYTGTCILDLSKTLMYKFYYDHLKLVYGPRCDLLYTDTDSLLINVKRDDVYKRATLTTTTRAITPRSTPSTAKKNKKVVGKMKDEYTGQRIKETICLRFEMYSILVGSNVNIKKAKGTTKQVTKKRSPTRTTRTRYSTQRPTSTG